MYRFREPVSGLSHLAGAVLAAAGLVWLVWLTRSDPLRMASLAIYGTSLVVLYAASAALHLTRGSERVILWLNRCDHAAIYAMIAGTYTAIGYNTLTGAWRWAVLASIWSLALAGIIYKLGFLKRDGHGSTLSYLAMGWLGLLVVPQALQVLPLQAIALVLAGGLLYTAGAVIFARQRPNFHRHFGFHELWHFFVLGGSALHFAAVLLYIARA